MRVSNMRRFLPVFSVLCTLLLFMLQVGPEDVVANAGKWYRLIPAKLISPPNRAIGSWLLGIAALASFLVWLFLVKRGKNELIPLRDAAGLVLDQTKTTGFGAWISNSSEEQTIYGIFCELLEHDIPVYGRQSPGTTFDRVRFDPNREALIGMNSIQPHHEDVRVTDLRVRRGDIKRLVTLEKAKDKEAMKKSSGR
jgi:hypothetical protein